MKQSFKSIKVSARDYVMRFTRFKFISAWHAANSIKSFPAFLKVHRVLWRGKVAVSTSWCSSENCFARFIWRRSAKHNFKTNFRSSGCLHLSSERKESKKSNWKMKLMMMQKIAFFLMKIAFIVWCFFALTLQTEIDSGVDCENFVLQQISFHLWEHKIISSSRGCQQVVSEKEWRSFSW